MKGYEAVFVTEAGISEETLKETLAKIESTITRHNGAIESKHVWGRRRLAYLIRKKEFGVYHLWYLTGDGTMLEELHRQYTYMDEVLRFQTVKVGDIAKERDYFLHVTSTPAEIRKKRDEEEVGGILEEPEESLADVVE